VSTVLTRDERQLLAAVSKHRRANSWHPTRTREGFRHNGAHLAVDWHWPWRADNKSGRTFRVRLLYPTGAPQQTVFSADVDSVQEAVDAAVLYGLLPLAFSSAYRAGLDAAHTAVAPRAIPQEFLRALLTQANGEDGLDVGEHELLEHHRTEVYRRVIESAWIAAQAEALGWQVEVNDVGDRILVLDRIDQEV
jgi:hypothetical protein